MMLPLYEGVMTLGAPAIELALLCRAKRGKEDPERMCERRGVARISRPEGQLVWLHASSVGESMAALVLIEKLVADRQDRTVLLTTGTVSSAEMMAKRLPERALHQFVPVDRPAWVRNFLDHWRPDVALVMESEFWPTQLSETHARGIPIVLVNARMSERSFSRWKLAGPFTRPLFSIFDLVMATNPVQASRFSALGAPLVRVPGNLKRAAPALSVDQAEADTLRAEIGDRPVWFAASTHAGEDAPVIDAHLGLCGRHPNLLTILAPRHPHRGDDIEEMAKAQGLRVSRRSRAEAITPDTEVYLADTMGEMGLFFSLSDIVFVAGSLVPVGGHNPIEPAHFGCAILFGPLMAKNAEIAAEMTLEGAAIQTSSGAEITEIVDRLLGDPDRRMELSGNAKRYVDDAGAVLDAVTTELRPFLDAAARRASE